MFGIKISNLRIQLTRLVTKMRDPGILLTRSVIKRSNPSIQLTRVGIKMPTAVILMPTTDIKLRKYDPWIPAGVTGVLLPFPE